MKLVEILARELKVWPEGTDGIWQSAQDNELYLDGPPKNQRPEWLCDDRGYDGRVTRADWEAEQPAPVSERKTSAGEKTYLAPESLGKAASNGDKRLADGIAATAPSDTMLAIRDRIRELDTQRAEVEATYQRQTSKITQERESLVQRLAGEGLALVGDKPGALLNWQRYAKDGMKINAIKEYRELTGAGLREAKETVEAYQDSIGWVQPAR
jgi:hypothetical protein